MKNIFILLNENNKSFILLNELKFQKKFKFEEIYIYI